MPAEPAQAGRFGMARRAQSTALFEDYVELIADLLAVHGEARTTEVAKRLGVRHPTAVKGIARLKREGLVTSRLYRGIFLTEAAANLPNERARATASSSSYFSHSAFPPRPRKPMRKAWSIMPRMRP
jgi:DtxR family manganese transport transcriptional regulator